MNKKDASLKTDILKYGSIIFLIFICGFMMTNSFVKKYPLIWSMSILSCFMGMQHAFDVDHLAVIDNISRKLTNEKRNADGVGFYFSLGHSLIVLMMTIILLIFVEKAQKSWPYLKQVGGIVSSLFAGCILLLLAVINSLIMYKTWQKIKNPKINILDESYKNSRSYNFFLKLLSMIKHNWQIVLIGCLFGLGFDTATQIGMLAISAMTLEKGIPIYVILAFPLLFTAGMCLWDTVDGLIVGSAYKWVYDNPIKKIYYNFILTGLSITAALITGIISLINAGEKVFNWNNDFVIWIEKLNFFQLGMILACLFLLIWTVILINWHKVKSLNENKLGNDIK